MAVKMEYKLISANSTPEFQTQLQSATLDKWKPILLTSCAAGITGATGYSIAAILERPSKR
jgi:hypothetical protein